MNRTAETIRTIIFLTAFLLSGQHLHAQDDSPKLVQDLPPTPQAEAFNRLGDYQVDNNYGVPNISIPLFEIDCHGYKIPLALHYEATPMKPGYNYDVTGIGWTLSGNSCVSRTIKDRPDELTIYNYTKPFELDSPADYPDPLEEFESPGNIYVPFFDYSEYFGNVNFQYDSYNILLPTGRSIPFFMYMKDNIMRYVLTDNDRKVKIKCNYDITVNPHTINSFSVIDEKGVKYDFMQAETGANNFDDDPYKWTNVTWLLTSVNIPSKGTISYEYANDSTIYTRAVQDPAVKFNRTTSQMLEDAGIPTFKVTKRFVSQCPRHKMKLLKSISYGPTKVEFDYSGNNMRDIVITEAQATIKKFALGINGSYLDSLVISGKNNVDKLVYRFDYWSNDYISSNYNYTDYWGNLIKNPNNNSDVANFNMFINNKERPDIVMDTTDVQQRPGIRFIQKKETDPNYYYKIKLQYSDGENTRKPTSPESHGVLKSISYPNGGYTEFTFENHRFPTATADDGDFVFDRRKQNIIEGGGFRVKSIVNYAADGTIANQDHYRYGFKYGDISRNNFPLPLPSSYNEDDHIGCGEAVVDPNILTFLSDFTCYDFSTGQYGFQKMLVGMDSPLKAMYNIQGSATWWDAEFSANAFRSLIDGRRPVVYPEITVYHGNPDLQDSCIAKSVYKYDIYNYQHGTNIDYLSLIRGTSERDTTYFEPLYYDYHNGNLDLPSLLLDDSKSARRHQLKSKEDYSYDAASHTWDLTHQENYTYQESYTPNALIGYVYNTNISRQRHTNYHYKLGDPMWYEHYSLADFYPTQIHPTVGQSTMVLKSSTQLHKGEVPSLDNTQTERYSYLYPGVLRQKEYPDVYYQIRNDFGGDYYDKRDVYSYVGEEEGDSIMKAMKDKNMLASMISAETFTNIGEHSKVKGSKVDYKFFGNDILPYKLYEANGDVYEESIEVISYDSFDNPKEILNMKTGVHSVYLWDEDGRYLLAEMQNVTWSQVQGHIDNLMKQGSKARYTYLKENLPDALVQTWDYEPLVGVSSHTDVNGQTVCYEYDGLGRLKAERRLVDGQQNPETIREYEYNYVNQ